MQIRELEARKDFKPCQSHVVGDGVRYKSQPEFRDFLRSSDYCCPIDSPWKLGGGGGKEETTLVRVLLQTPSVRRGLTLTLERIYSSPDRIILS